MEQVLYLQGIQNLEMWNPSYERLYFGTEFCDRKLPSIKEIEKIIDFTTLRSSKFTMVLPFISQGSVEKIKSVLAFIASAVESCEVVFNDWGGFQLIQNYDRLVPVLGRLLTKQRRDPRLGKYVQKFSSDTVAYFQESYIDSAYSEDFLLSKGIERIEFDNTIIGLRRNGKIKGSLYYPYCFLTTTRYCQTAMCEKQLDYYRWIKPCQKECLKYEFKLSHQSIPLPLHMKGNATFYMSDKIPDNLEALNVDRMVKIAGL